MGILIANDVELAILVVLNQSREDSVSIGVIVANIIVKLDNDGFFQSRLTGDDLKLMAKIIKTILEEPDHPLNTPTQDLFRRARRIYHELVDERINRVGGFLTGAGMIHTTRGSFPLSI